MYPFIGEPTPTGSQADSIRRVPFAQQCYLQVQFDLSVVIELIMEPVARVSGWAPGFAPFT
jgi:hypothetical protein